MNETLEENPQNGKKLQQNAWGIGLSSAHPHVVKPQRTIAITIERCSLGWDRHTDDHDNLYTIV